jgi:hypothetical protein
LKGAGQIDQFRGGKYRSGKGPPRKRAEPGSPDSLLRSPASESGMELSKQSKRIQPSPPVLVFRMHSEKRYEPRAFYAAGYIPIRAGPDVVSKHIISQVR